MKNNYMILAGAAATTVNSLAIPGVKRDGGSVSITPHDVYGSSIGVLGCKVDVNRIAYWPSMPSCDSNCVKVSGPGGRSVHLLHVDSSGGAYDISYDAWNYLKTGQSATSNPVAGGGFDATWERADMSACADIIKPEAQGKLAFTAANSMNFIVSCPASSWVGQNYALYNIADQNACNAGVDEICHYHPSVSNQPSCPTSKLGVTTPLAGDPVYNIQYPTGDKVLALA